MKINTFLTSFPCSIELLQYAHLVGSHIRVPLLRQQITNTANNHFHPVQFYGLLPYWFTCEISHISPLPDLWPTCYYGSGANFILRLIRLFAAMEVNGDLVRLFPIIRFNLICAISTAAGDHDGKSQLSHVFLFALVARLAERFFNLMRVNHSTSSDYSYAGGGYFVGVLPGWFVVRLGDNSKSPLY